MTSRDDLLDAMRRLALAKGFPATSVDEICERAGVSKGSFYHHFSSKNELGVAALEAYFGDVVAAFTQGPWTEVEDPVVRLAAFMSHAGEVCVGPVMANGCLIGSFALDLAESWPEVRASLSTMFAAVRDFVAGVVAAAADHRGRAIDSAAFGDQFITVIEGSIVLAKARADPTVPQRQMALLGQHLELLLA